MTGELEIRELLELSNLGWLELALVLFVLVFCAATVRWGWWVDPGADNSGQGSTAHSDGGDSLCRWTRRLPSYEQEGSENVSS